MLSSVRKEKIQELLNKLNIKTDNYLLFDEALTHPSYNKEASTDKGYDYERLEFLGDSILRSAAGEYLFEKYPDYDEGKLTKIRSCIVSDKFLFKIAENLEYYKYIELGNGEEKDRGRQKESILACTFESVLGAIYLSAGYKVARDFIYELYSRENIEETVHYYNAKEMLQEYTQGKNKDLPEYKVVAEYGPAHRKEFEICVFYHNQKLGQGRGKTKKDAEQSAAKSALEKLGIICPSKIPR